MGVHKARRRLEPTARLRARARAAARSLEAEERRGGLLLPCIWHSRRRNHAALAQGLREIHLQLAAGWGSNRICRLRRVGDDA
eukprot:8220916-Pyramimonas_sp.AAC.1